MLLGYIYKDDDTGYDFGWILRDDDNMVAKKKKNNNKLSMMDAEPKNATKACKERSSKWAKKQ